jgi:hypothetical protein
MCGLRVRSFRMTVGMGNRTDVSDAWCDNTAYPFSAAIDMEISAARAE